MPIYKVEGVKKDGKQKYRVVVNYTNSAGKYDKAERIAYGKPEAELIEAKLKAKYKNQGQSTSTNMTIQELYNIYIENKKHDVRETSLDKSSGILKRHVLPHLANQKIKNLSAIILQEWKNKINDLGLKLVTRQNIYTELRTMLNYAVRMNYLQKNPLYAVGNFKDANVFDNIEPDELNFYTPEEFMLYIKEAEKKCKTIIDWGYYVYFNILYYMGFRKGEANALRWSRRKNNCLYVKRNVVQKLKGGDRETLPKNKSSYRATQIPKPLKKILDEHYERCKKLKGFNNEFYICGCLRPLRDSTIDNRNRLYAEAAGLHHIAIKDFRHSHASLLINEGVNIQEIARRLGHANIQVTTKTYIHLFPREEDKAIEVLNKF